MSFGKRLREYRLKRGLTQNQLADKLNMTEANISSYERDKSSPPSDILNQLTKILGVSADVLLGKDPVLAKDNVFDMLIMLLLEHSAPTAVDQGTERLLDYNETAELIGGLSEEGRREIIDDLFKTLQKNHPEQYIEFVRRVLPEIPKGQIESIIKKTQGVEPQTFAAHHDGDNWTEEELQDIEEFKEILKLKRQLKKNKE